MSMDSAPGCRPWFANAAASPSTPSGSPITRLNLSRISRIDGSSSSAFECTWPRRTSDPNCALMAYSAMCFLSSSFNEISAARANISAASLCLPCLDNKTPPA